MVDLDHAELEKMERVGRKIDWPICADAGAFIAAFDTARQKVWWLERGADWNAWTHQVQAWRVSFDTPSVDWPGINPYALMKEIAQWTTTDDTIVSDTGTALGYLMQGFPFKGERFLHAFNMTPMGYGLPAAIGAAFATGRRVVLVTGDGSMMMSLPELATIARWQLPIKIILLNNGGHAMCRQTQRQWLGGSYPGTSIEGGLGFPDFTKTALSFDIPVAAKLIDLMYYPGSGFMEVAIDPDAQLIPQAKYGQPLEDADPQLPRAEFAAQMIVPPLVPA